MNFQYAFDATITVAGIIATLFFIRRWFWMEMKIRHPVKDEDFVADERQRMKDAKGEI